MKPSKSEIALTVLSIFAAIALSFCLTGCTSTRLKIDELAQEDFDALDRRVSLYAHATSLVLLDQDVSRTKLGKVAGAVELIASDDAATAVAGLITSKLSEAGLGAESMLVLLVLEDTLHRWGALGELGQPLSPRTRTLLSTVARAMKEASVSTPSPAEIEAAKNAVATEAHQ